MIKQGLTGMPVPFPTTLTLFHFVSRCKKMYLYQSSLKKHLLVSHEVEYKQYLAERRSKCYQLEEVFNRPRIESRIVLIAFVEINQGHPQLLIGLDLE